MKNIGWVFLLILANLFPVQAQLSVHDLNTPFGWAVCTSLTSGDDYRLTGGGNGSSITLTSNGGDMKEALYDAIQRYDIVVLDGSAGDFSISSSLSLKGLRNKTIVGINGARLCSAFSVTEEIKAALDSVGVKNMSGSDGGGTLVNGAEVKEEGEYYTRKTLIELLGDEKESYRKSGIFTLNLCENLIIRNLAFVGPGSVDVGGYDLISVTGSTHLWVDHCSFTDGMDGNMDITQRADFVTVSWCTFAYTSCSYAHAFSNLIAGSDDPSQGEYNLNVTWANCWWQTGCQNRMPMARFGVIHLINNFYDCPGASRCINPRKESDFRIEGNYFAPGVTRIFSQTDATACVWKDNLFSEAFTPEDFGSVLIPYTYPLYEASEVEAVVSNPRNGAGPTLEEPLDMTRHTSHIGESSAGPAMRQAGLSVIAPNATTPLSLYSTDGRLLHSATGRLCLAAYPRGTYIVSDGNRQLKIVRP